MKPEQPAVGAVLPPSLPPQKEDDEDKNFARGGTMEISEDRRTASQGRLA